MLLSYPHFGKKVGVLKGVVGQKVGMARQKKIYFFSLHKQAYGYRPPLSVIPRSAPVIGGWGKRRKVRLASKVVPGL